MSPRKSSTSSGKRTASRPRYLGVEAAGALVPVESLGAWHAILDGHDPRALVEFRYRVVKSDARRAIVEVDQHSLSDARARWNFVSDPAAHESLRTEKTWGTLVGAKAWIRGRPKRDPGRSS